jgi:hypothetical protein
MTRRRACSRQPPGAKSFASLIKLLSAPWPSARTASRSSQRAAHWLHLYERGGDVWHPQANFHVPVLWHGDLRFLPRASDCTRCVEVIRDVPENEFKLDRINFDDPGPPIKGDPQQLVSEWSAKFGLTFDARGHIVRLESSPAK